MTTELLQSQHSRPSHLAPPPTHRTHSSCFQTDYPLLLLFTDSPPGVIPHLSDTVSSLSSTAPPSQRLPPVPPLPTACSQLINLTHFFLLPTLTKDAYASRKIKYHSIMLGYFRLNMYQDSALPSGFPFFLSFPNRREEDKNNHTPSHTGSELMMCICISLCGVNVRIQKKGVC